MRTMSPAARHVHRRSDRLAAVADFGRAGAPASMARRIAAGSSLRGLSSVTMTTSLKSRGDRAHVRALALVAVAAGAEHSDQAALDVRAERGDRGFDRIGGVGIIDIDRRAGAADHRALEPPAHRRNARPCRARSSPSRRRSRARGPPRRVRWRPGRRRSAASSNLCSRPACASTSDWPSGVGVRLDEPDRLARFADGDQLAGPRALARVDDLARARVVGPDHRRAVRRRRLRRTAASWRRNSRPCRRDNRGGRG